MDKENKIIQFDNYFRPSVRYQKTLREFADKLESVSEEFFGIALNLAVSGKWKKWDASMPIGASFSFSEDMLFGTGDEFVTEAINLRIAISDLAESVRARMDRRLKKGIIKFKGR